MIIIIPIGGIGKRFKENGYKKPKALINIFGKPMISYLLDNLDTDEIDYIFIPYNKEYKEYDFENFLTKLYPKFCFKFHCLENNTRGAAETINISINNLNEERDIPVICLDCDSFYICNIISMWNGTNCVFTFEDSTEKAIFSYVKTNKDNIISDIKEKEKISNNACTGAYAFNSINKLRKYTKKIIEEKLKQKSEFYTSGVIKEMINEGIIYTNIKIKREEFIQLGIHSDVEKFKTNLIIKNINKHEKIILDIQGHSNFDINVLNINNIKFLCKSSNNYEDSIRLNRQIEKQQYHNKFFKINTPDIVFKSKIVNDKVYFLMNYLNYSDNIFNYLINNNLGLENIFIFIKDLIDTYINNSVSKKIEKKVVIDKINGITQNIENLYKKKILNKDELDYVIKKINILEQDYKYISNINLPIGCCHGDLTLCNMLIDKTNNKIYLFDFLDSFIESPLFDIIKIRQDTKYFWFLKMLNFEIDKNKIKIIMNYLDTKLHNYFKKYDFYNSKLYDYFEIINILRILQYCKSTEVKDFLLNCLN